jgi:glycosyltransferase involved in cell wall biosynthesis
MMQKKHNLKVLLVSPSPPPVGGIQSWTVNILDFLRHQDQIGFYYVDSAVKYRGMLEIGLWKRITAGVRVTYDIIIAVKKAIRISSPDIIHLTSSASLALLKDYLILFIAKKFNVPVIMHWRFGRIPELAIKKNWEWRLISYVIRKSAYSIVIDGHSYKALKDAGFIKVVNIANPVSSELAIIANKQINLERNFEVGKVVFVGHVYVNKGIYELVAACSESCLVKQLILIGPFKDEVKDELEAIARKREDGRWLKLTGEKTREEVYTEIRSAELLVLPSYTEGFPNVIVESMAMACPVVATNVGAIPEMLNIDSDTPSGLCVPVKKIDELKISIEKILSNRELGAQFGRNGLTRVLENFTLDNIFEEYRSIWQTVANNNIC